MPANLTTKLGQLVDVLTPDTTNTRIGVANASPTRTLDVTGTFGASGASTLGGTLTAAGTITTTVSQNSEFAALKLFNNNAGGGSEATSIQLGYGTSGSYGYKLLNTNNPAAQGAGTFKLQRGTSAAWTDVWSSSNTGDMTFSENVTVNSNVTAGYTSTGPQLILGKGDGTGTYAGTIYADTALIFAKAYVAERARIDTSGNFLLGTTTAQALLTVKGATQIIGTGSSTAGGSGPSSGKITKQATSSTSALSVSVTGTGFNNAGWVNGVIKITAAGGNLYSGNQGGIFAVYNFQGLSGFTPRNFGLMGTAMTSGATITISFASSSSETLVVTASMSDGNVPGSIPSQNMSMTVEVDYGYPFTLS